jgi:WXXGXW repeat (2 copies)
MKRLIGILFFTTALALATSLSAAVVYIRTAPPAPQSVVVIGAKPGPGYVWTGGYWAWQGGRYVWIPGRWLRPPRAGVVWVAPHYVHHTGGYVFVAGTWR